MPSGSPRGGGSTNLPPRDCLADFGRPLTKVVMSHSRDGPGVMAPSRTNVVPLTGVWNPPPSVTPPQKVPDIAVLGDRSDQSSAPHTHGEAQKLPWKGPFWPDWRLLGQAHVCRAPLFEEERRCNTRGGKASESLSEEDCPLEALRGYLFSSNSHWKTCERSS